MVIVAVAIAGCTSTINQPTTQLSPVDTPTQIATTTLSASLTTTNSPIIPETTTSKQLEMGTKSDTGAQIESTTKFFKPFTNDEYKISMIYPADWEKEELYEVSLRDYGQETINIVNFFSPTLNSEYATFSIDVHPKIDTELDDYYNHAIVALHLTDPQITRRMSNFNIYAKTANRIDYLSCERSDNEVCHKTKNIKVFTYINKNIYIFSFSGGYDIYDDNLDEAEAMLKSVEIVPVTTEKHR
jgi:hypothetical protein